jgi:hypothetical protein
MAVAGVPRTAVEVGAELGHGPGLVGLVDETPRGL